MAAGLLSSFRLFFLRFSSSAIHGKFVPQHSFVPAKACFISCDTFGFQDPYKGSYLCMPLVRYFSSNAQQPLFLQGSLSATLLMKLENAISNHHPDVAWETLMDYKRLYGYPKKNVLSNLVIMLSYASERRWLNRAYKLVEMILKEKSELPHSGSLVRLSLTLARSQIPVSASTILRVVLEKDSFLSMDTWSAIFFHMVKTEIGSCLASNILVEICECFLQQRSDKRKLKPSKMLKPGTTLFNIVLSSCLQFGSMLKAQQVIDMMRRIGILADANSINIIARVYEMNGQREDLMNLEEHVACVSSLPVHRHYQQFYESLLNLHFKFNDSDAAGNLILAMDTGFKSAGCSTFPSNFELEQPHLVQVGSSNLKIGYKMLAKPEQLQNDFVFQPRSSSGLIELKDGKLSATRKALSKLIHALVTEKRVEELSNFLIHLHKEKNSAYKENLCSEVIDACVQIGWLETAHDILDNFEREKIPINSSSYQSLFKEYCQRNRLQEANILLKQMKKADMPTADEDTHAVQSCSRSATNLHTEPASIVKKSSLVELLEKESREDIRTCQSLYDLNSSILFFCKTKMMEDAMRTFRKMHERNVDANIQTFVHLVNGYSSLEMFREITILWGEIKRRTEAGVLAPNRDLLDCLLLNFIRGGYFERVNEIIDYMNSYSMYIDRWMYRREFFKLHRALYRNLKSSDAKDDVQKKRLEHVKAFRKWARIGVE